ncbi:hypothetical protein ACFIOZ_11150 [Vreelandella sp. F11]|uniref:hypothetical protein n=1 Tax=Vreelandella sp. F11 TaxID=3394751 RepID=UPI0036DBA68D
MTNENTKKMGFWGFISACGSALVLLGGGVVGAVAFFDLKLFPVDSVVSITELQANYLHRSVVEADYVEKSKVYQQYVPREEMEMILEGYIPSESVLTEYVPKQQYELLTRENSSLKDKLYGIPSPLEPVRRELSPRGNWHDERFGIFIEMNQYYGSEGNIKAVFALQLPDSALHEEHVSDEQGSIRRWRFHKAGREFELFMERVHPPVFVVSEI